MSRDAKLLAVFVLVFLGAYFVPLADPKITAAILEAFKLLQWYVRNHTLACVVPALFIAGAITTFLSPPAVLRYLGPDAPKPTAYAVASVSGTVLAVCSCSVLPMFAGIYRLGAGLGPASAFLYSGPAINILAIFLTARVLGWDLGVWRAGGAVVFAVLVGLAMAAMFRREDRASAAAAAQMPVDPAHRPLWKNGLLLGSMLAFLVFSDWFHPGDALVRRHDGSEISGVVLQETRDEIVVQVDADEKGGPSQRLVLAKQDIAEVQESEGWVMNVYRIRWYLAAAMGLLVLVLGWRWLSRAELREWMHHTWEFTRMLVPLLFGGVFAVGFVSALLPSETIGRLVGDGGLAANLLASVVGTLFYFATLTEVPITQALMDHGMARGPALALLLAGPALSLPSILVLVKVMGARKTVAFTTIVVVAATLTGLVYGMK